MMKVKYYQTVGDFEKEGDFISALFMAYLGLIKHVTSVSIFCPFLIDKKVQNIPKIDSYVLEYCIC